MTFGASGYLICKSCPEPVRDVPMFFAVEHGIPNQGDYITHYLHPTPMQVMQTLHQKESNHTTIHILVYHTAKQFMPDFGIELFPEEEPVEELDYADE